MMGAGLLSRAEFERQVERFVDISNRINDQWQLVRAANNVLYMVKKCVASPTTDISQTDIRRTTSSSSNMVSMVASDRPPSQGGSTSPTIATSTASSLDAHLQPEITFLSELSVLSTMTPYSACQPIRATETQPRDTLFEYKSASHTGTQNAVSSDTSKKKHEFLTQQCCGETPRSPSLLAERHQAALDAHKLTATATPDPTGEHCGTDSSFGAHFPSSEMSLTSPLEMEMEIDSEDESCMTECRPQEKPLVYEYHVLYSESYSVPVLYLNIFTPDGKLLPLNEAWNLCPQNYQAHMKENKWTTLTQQEHPVLGRPYLQLHPCHTADLMAQVTSGIQAEPSKNYLATWLSTVGPLIALKIAPAYIFG